ncbi:MAG: Smr/MutS family protein [Bacilli bacterium]|nr:Smr/MutS family protein [Bacilli bacterium]
MYLNDIFLDNLPQIDLHGFDRESARVLTNDFINEAISLGYKKIIIIHGIGTGIIKNAVHETLSKNKYVLSYQLDSSNIGCTIVHINEKEKSKKSTDDSK